MNEKNLNYLKEQVKYTGFGEGLESQLVEKINAGAPEFTINHQAFYGNDEVSATLYFKKSSQQNYFFNRYDLSVKPEDVQVPLRQSFYIGYDNNITLKEGYNLLSGRSVQKELARLVDDGNGRQQAKGEKYTAWIKLDLSERDSSGNYKQKQFHQNWGYDLEKVLEKFAIKELTIPEERIKLLASLRKGNVQAVTFTIDGKDERRYIEAVPQFKSINQYDANMQRVGIKRVQNQAKGQSESQKVGDANDDVGPKKVAGQKKRNVEKNKVRQKAARTKKKELSI